METTETLTHLSQFFIGLAITVLFAGLSWWIASAISKKKWNRYSLAEVEATKIRDSIVAMHNSFRGKYMPPALRELLAESWSDFSSLAQQAHSVDSNEELLAFTAAVNDVLENIRKQALVEPTAADFEADMGELVHEEVELQSKYEESVSRLEKELSSKREHVKKMRDQLEVQRVAWLDQGSLV